MAKLKARIYDRSDKLLRIQEGEFKDNQLIWYEGGIKPLSVIPLLGDFFKPKEISIGCNYSQCYDEGKTMVGMYHEEGGVYTQIPRKQGEICKICEHFRTTHPSDKACNVEGCICKGFILLKDINSAGVDQQQADLTKELAEARFDANVKSPLSQLEWIQLGLSIIGIMVLVGVLYSLNNLDKASTPLASAVYASTNVTAYNTNVLIGINTTLRYCISDLRAYGASQPVAALPAG